MIIESIKMEVQVRRLASGTLQTITGPEGQVVLATVLELSPYDPRFA